MSVVLESGMVRSFLHHLVDGFVDEVVRLIEDIESRATSPVQPIVAPPPARAAADKPRITLNEPAKKRRRAKSEPHRRKFPPRDVTVACRSSCGRLEIAVSLSAEVAKRLDLKPRGKAGAVLRNGKLRVCGSTHGRTVFPGGTSGRLWFATIADFFGVTEKHAAEGCTFHYDLEDALLIEPPAWLKQAAAKAPSAKPAGQKTTADPPVSCKKMAGTNPAIKCGACNNATATVECTRCPILLCDDCWDPHVRKHWHTAVTSRAPTGRAAAAGR